MTVVVESKAWDAMSNEAKDLVLHADNDAHLYNTSHKPIIANLAKKMTKGVYDKDTATKLWGYHADRAAMSCCKQHGGVDDVWHKMYKPSHRKEAAAHWENLHRDDLEHEHKRHTMHESHDIMLAETTKTSILGMIASAMEDKPATFAEHFANAVQPRLEDTIEAMKDELKKFVFNHMSGKSMFENVNCRSKMLLAAKAKKTAWKGGDNPTDTIELNDPDDADFDNRDDYGAQHEAWGNRYETPKSKRGMFKGRSLSSLEAEDKHVSGKKKHQVDFAIRAKKHWKGGV